MSKCCRLCCKEFKGWCKAFTKTEAALAIIEAILLIIFIGFLTFLVLHLMTCRVEKPRPAPKRKPPIRPTPDYSGGHTHGKPIDDDSQFLDQTLPTTKCTYSPHVPQKPKPWTKSTRCTASFPKITTESSKDIHSEAIEDYDATDATPGTTDILDAEESDGELADSDDKNVVIALVKIKPSGITFGCILTILSDHWTVTAASCIDSIEEVDSLDSFVMMDDYGEEKKGQSHSVSDVRVHPQYEAGNSSYDLALLKTDDALGKRAAQLPTLLDYFRITIGEKMEILGFGNFRSIDHGPLGQRVRAAGVYSLPHAQCTQSRDTGTRHLIPKTRELHARCAASPLCAGVRFARGSPCNYCAGAPLVARSRLLGIMADNGACGAACEPALYANVAALRAWLTHVIA